MHNVPKESEKLVRMAWFLKQCTYCNKFKCDYASWIKVKLGITVLLILRKHFNINQCCSFRTHVTSLSLPRICKLFQKQIFFSDLNFYRKCFFVFQVFFVLKWEGDLAMKTAVSNLRHVEVTKDSTRHMTRNSKYFGRNGPSTSTHYPFKNLVS